MKFRRFSFEALVFMATLGSSETVFAQDFGVNEVKEEVNALVDQPAFFWTYYLAQFDNEKTYGADENVHIISLRVFDQLFGLGFVNIIPNDKHGWSLVDFVFLEPIKPYVLELYGADKEYDNEVKLRIGIFDQITILGVESTDREECEWNITFRAWIREPTPVGEALQKAIGKTFDDDGLKYMFCYKVGRSGLEVVYESLLENYK